MSSRLNPIAYNPVLTKDAATIIIWLAAKYGFNLSVEEATAIAGVFFTGAAFFVRQLVRPVAKDPTLLPLITEPKPIVRINGTATPKLPGKPEHPDPTP